MRLWQSRINARACQPGGAFPPLVAAAASGLAATSPPVRAAVERALNGNCRAGGGLLLLQRRLDLSRTSFRALRRRASSCSQMAIRGLMDGFFGPFLLAYAQSAARRWVAFAESNAVIVLVPALGAGEFAGYREMFGRRIDADEYVNTLVDRSAGPLIHGFDGRFVLHGHSAGGQFAARYLVTHPSRLHRAILSAPSTYPFPDPKVVWPNGMGAVARDALSGARAGKLYSPDPGGWLRAASEVPVTVLVGSRDTETRPASPGQPGSTRLDRAKAWVLAMTQLAESSRKTSTVHLVIEPGLDHDEATIGVPAQRILAARPAS